MTRNETAALNLKSVYAMDELGQKEQFELATFIHQEEKTRIKSQGYPTCASPVANDLPVIGALVS